MSELRSLLDRNNNSLDMLRFAAATTVIFSHAYPLSQRNETIEPFILLTNQSFTGGGIAVAVFFILSGFLITASAERSPNWWHYLKARLLRIYPGVIVVSLLTVFVLGPTITTIDLQHYFASPLTGGFLRGIPTLNMGGSLPGVFEHNVHQGRSTAPCGRFATNSFAIWS